MATGKPQVQCPSDSSKATASEMPEELPIAVSQDEEVNIVPVGDSKLKRSHFGTMSPSKGRNCVLRLPPSDES